jgi:hypothetical protein
MKRLGVRMCSINECRIHKDITTGSQQQSPDPLTNAAMGRGPSLQGLDIDGIIQSFVREQEHAQMTQAGTPEHIVLANSTTPTPMPAPRRAPALAETMLDDAGTLSYDYNGPWLAQPTMFADTSVPVDDLYYGFNSAALDSFPITPFLEWNTM